MKFKISSYLIILIVVLGLTVCKAPTEKAFDPEIADIMVARQHVGGYL